LDNKRCCATFGPSLVMTLKSGRMSTRIPYSLKLLLRRISCLLFFSLIMLACSPSRKLMKEAETLENGGLSGEALNRYSQVYSEYRHTDALVGMKRVAQKVFDGKLQNAQMQTMAGNYDDALAAYDDAIAFRSTYAHLELKSVRAPEEMRRDCRNLYIDALYQTAEDYVKNEDYDAAHILIQKIFRLDRNNKKAEYLDAMCEILPNYKAGIKAEEKELWREAYIYFNEVVRVDPGFSDATKRREEALKKGTFSLVYKITDNRFVENRHENALAAHIKGVLLKSDNPFIELLEREDLEVILQEQQETMSPQFEDGTGANAGKLKRASFVLSGELVNVTYDDTPEQISKCDCGAVYRIYSDKVDCYAYSSSATINATFKFKLMDAETGKLYQSEVVKFSKEDLGRRYSYEIRQKISLTSPTGLRDHDVNLASMITPEIDQLLTEDDMYHLMQKHFAEKVGQIMNGFRP
jgi:tetratricopeptide (TPR) repeat protein